MTVSFVLHIGRIRLRPWRWQYPRTCRPFAAAASTVTSADPSLVDRSQAAADWDPESAVVYPSAISEAQAAALVQILTKKFRRYETWLMWPG